MARTGTLTPYRGTAEPDERSWVRHVVPWALWVAMLGAGLAAHRAWGGDPALPWITSVLTLAVAGLSWMAWRVAQARRVGPAGRSHVAATVALVGGWLLAATVAGPVARGVVDAWGLGAVLAASWNVRMLLHVPARSEDDGQPTTPRRAGKALMAALGVRGAELVPDPAQTTPHRVAGALELTSGEHTVEEVQKKSHHLAAALGIPKAGVRFTEDPTNASRGEFSLTLRDVLNVETPWPGPTAVAGTVFDPIPMGLYETGATLWKKIADPAGAKHELIQGTTGAGKSSGSKVELCELMTRREVALIVLDTVKGIQTFGPAAPGLAWFITDEPTAKRFMKRLMVVIKARTDYLGAKDLSEWIPGCGLVFLVVQIEEAGIMLEELGDEFKNVVKAARSAGIAVKVSLQRPSHDEMPTTARAQLGTISCYGMANDDPVCMLPEKVQDAGADPRQWGDRLPGACYVAGTGITVAQASTPVRTYRVDVAVMAQVAQEYGPRMTPLDAVTTRAFGELWTRRVEPVELVRRTKEAALRGGTGEAPPLRLADESDAVVDGPVDADREHDEDQEEVMAVTEEEMGVETPDPDPSVTGSIDDEVTALGVDLAFGPPREEVTPEEARAAVAERLARIEGDGRDTVRVPDFADLVKARLRSRGWFRKELLRLVGTGRLVDEGDGEFRIVPVDDDEPDDGEPDDGDQGDELGAAA